MGTASRPGLLFKTVEFENLGAITQIGTDLAEILRDRIAQRDRGSAASRLIVASRRQSGVHPGHILAELSPHRERDALGSIREQRIIGKLAHAHRVFQHLPDSSHARARIRGADGHHIDIELRREAAVDAQLLFTEVAAFGQRGEIEKTEIHRLLDLVGIGTGQNDPGNMSLNEPRSRYRMRVGRRPEQRRDQRVGCRERHR